MFQGNVWKAVSVSAVTSIKMVKAVAAGKQSVALRLLSSRRGWWKCRHLLSSMFCGIRQLWVFRPGVRTQARWIAVSSKFISRRELVGSKNGKGLHIMLQIFLLHLHAVCRRGREVYLADDRAAGESLPPAWFPVPAGDSCWYCRAPPVSQSRWRRASGFSVWMTGVTPWRMPHVCQARM